MQYKYFILVFLGLLFACTEKVHHRQPDPTDSSKPVIYRGRVTGATPIQGATIRVRRLNNGLIGDTLGETKSGAQGEFSLAVVAGPGIIFFEALAPNGGATYRSVLTNRDVAFSDAALLLHIQHQPGRLPCTAENLSINAITTQIAHQALAQMQPCGASCDQQLSFFNDLTEAWSAYLNPESPVDPRFTYPANLTSEDVLKAGEAAIRLALYHVSLECLASTITANRHPLTAPLPWIHLLAMLVKDTSDGYLDGYSTDADTPISIGGTYAMSPDTARHDLAEAGMRCLNSALPDGSDLHKRTKVKPAAVRAFFDQITANKSPLIFGENSLASAPADWQPPALELAESPNNNSWNRICVQAADDSEIVDFSLSDGTFQDVEVNGSLLCGTVDLANLTDGPTDVTVLATDTAGNISSLDLTVNINREPPTIQIRGPAPNTTVRGDAEITFTCSDGNGIGRCEVFSPSEIVDTDPDPAIFQGIWHSTSSTEGKNFITLQAVDRDGRITYSSIAVFVDNIEPGKVCGAVFADSLVKDVTVTAYAYRTDGAEGAVLGAGNSQHEGFCITMDDTYTGPVLFEAAGSTATYASAVLIKSQSPDTAAWTNQNVSLDQNILTALLPHYTPGKNLQGLSINYLSTLATDLVAAYQYRQPPWVAGMSFDALVELAHRYLGQHARADRSVINVRNTFVRDLVMDTPFANSTSSDSTALGLISVGLGRMGAEIAVAEGNPAESLPGIAVHALLRNDLENAVLDGLNGAGEALFFTPRNITPVSVDSFRRDLARNIQLWLGNEPIDASLSGQNRTPDLHQKDFDGRDGLVQAITEDNSQLFDQTVPATLWDISPPQFKRVHIVDASGHLLDPTKPISATVTVSVEVSDHSAIAFLTARLVDNSWEASADAGATTFQQTIATRQFADGPYTLELSAADTHGNVTPPVTMVLRIDNTPPSVTITIPNQNTAGWVRSQTITLSGLVGDASPLQSISFLVDGMVKSQQMSPAAGNYNKTIDLGSCNAEHRVRVDVVDAAGNTASSATLLLRCDNTAPSIDFNFPTYFCPAGTCLTASYNEQGDLLFNAANNTETNWDKIGDRLVVKQFYHLLDESVVQRSGLTKSPIPSIKFIMEDRAPNQSGITSGSASVLYRTTKNGVIMRDWAAPSAVVGEPNKYIIPLSYQGLLTSNTIAANNPMFTSAAADLYRIDIKATDQIGNESALFSKAFTLQLMAPPVMVRGCYLDPEIANMGFADLGSVYASNSDRRFLRGTILWGSASASSSLVPEIFPEVMLSGGIASSTITSTMKRFIPSKQRTETRLDARCTTSPIGGWAFTYDDETFIFHCYSGLPAEGASSRKTTAFQTRHNVSFAVEGATALNKNTYALETGSFKFDLTALNLSLTIYRSNLSMERVRASNGAPLGYEMFTRTGTLWTRSISSLDRIIHYKEPFQHIDYANSIKASIDDFALSAKHSQFPNIEFSVQTDASCASPSFTKTWSQ